ncbi:interferon gamma receptor 1 isoform X2 [Sander lucioperca]|uniref:interferon gamma receptor 1 isoform X2 n=1 Tax=Sander lucioperca TaxID=283035 RepID=UPI00125E8BCB|nr:interferon gamma receptor 1 isoform X2 [Sander lucioperca]
MLLSTVLVLLLSRAAATAYVPPPTNVTLSCLNLHVAVTWDYSEHGPQTRFIVQIEGSEGKPYQNETTDHRYNLSDYIWASEKRYMDLHYVTVTAVEGGNQSEPVTSETLSFNDLKTVKIKCELDFPPVDVYEKDSGATVSFRNPLHYYSQLKHAVKTDATIFKFSSDYEDFEAARNHWDGEYDPVSSTDYSLLTVIPAKPCKNLSVSSEDGDSLSKDRDSLTEDSCCSSSGGELGDGYRGDEDFAEDSVKTETLSIDVEGMEENERSPYDCPHNLPRNLQVDMGDGDMVTGYSERERQS